MESSLSRLSTDEHIVIVASTVNNVMVSTSAGVSTERKICFFISSHLATCCCCCDSVVCLRRSLWHGISKDVTQTFIALEMDLATVTANERRRTCLRWLLLWACQSIYLGVEERWGSQLILCTHELITLRLMSATHTYTHVLPAQKRASICVSRCEMEKRPCPSSFERLTAAFNTYLWIFFLLLFRCCWHRWSCSYINNSRRQ